MKPLLSSRKRVLWAIALAVAGSAALWLVFRAYQQPGLLLEFMNLRYCY